VPAFAAVDDAVTLAPRTPGVAAFVNAVLRSFARRGAREREPAPPRDPLTALAARCSFPTWLAERWVERYGAGDAEALMRRSNERPPLHPSGEHARDHARRARPAPAPRKRGSRADASAAAEGSRGGPAAPGRMARVRGRKLRGPGRGVDADRAAPGARARATVADVCAAPGTKTTHLAELMENRGHILAFDREPSRLARVDEAAARLGISIIATRDGAVEALAPSFAAACDGVLVDAPCSNLGVLRRNPEVKWRRRPGDLALASRRQFEILSAAARWYGPAAGSSTRRARSSPRRTRRSCAPSWREARVHAGAARAIPAGRWTPTAGSAACRTATAPTASRPSASAAPAFAV
jgi:16S rRNA (cytosine967-C5)-methyltransferase